LCIYNYQLATQIDRIDKFIQLNQVLIVQLAKRQKSLTVYIVVDRDSLKVSRENFELSAYINPTAPCRMPQEFLGVYRNSD